MDLYCCALYFLGPFLWMVSVSFRNKADIFDPGNIFASFTTINYQTIFKDNIMRLFINSAIIAVSSTLISLVFGSLAAYGFARFNWRKRESRAFWVLSQRFLPAMAVIVPYFMLAAMFRVLDTVFPAGHLLYHGQPALCDMDDARFYRRLAH